MSGPTADLTAEPDGDRRAAGVDGGELVKERKRFVVVGALGLLLSVRVVPANVEESTAGKDLPRDLADSPRLRKALADGGYAGAPMADPGRSLKIEVEVAKTEKRKGFRIVARRWVVERTFAWLVKCWRLRIDYEANARTGAAWMQAATARLMARRLAKAT